MSLHQMDINSRDDGYEKGCESYYYTFSDSLRLGYIFCSITTMVRYRSFCQPKGYRLRNAYMLFHPDSDASTTVSVSISGHKSTSSGEIYDYENLSNTRSKTTSRVTWSSIGSWSVNSLGSTSLNTPDIVGPINEVLGQSGWTPCGSLSIILEYTGSSTGERYARAIDYGEPQRAPQIITTWEPDPAQPVNTVPFAEWDGYLGFEFESFFGQRHHYTHNGYEYYTTELRDPNCGGGKAMQFYAYAPESATSQNSELPRIDFTYQIRTPGNYYFWTHALAPTVDQNSVYITINGVSLPYSLTMSTTGVFDWTNEYWIPSNFYWGLTYNFTSAGTYSMSIWMREGNFQMDKFIAVHESWSWSPQGSSQPESPRNNYCPAGSGCYVLHYRFGAASGKTRLKYAPINPTLFPFGISSIVGVSLFNYDEFTVQRQVWIDSLQSPWSNAHLNCNSQNTQASPRSGAWAFACTVSSGGYMGFSTTEAVNYTVDPSTLSFSFYTQCYNPTAQLLLREGATTAATISLNSLVGGYINGYSWYDVSIDIRTTLGRTNYNIDSIRFTLPSSSCYWKVDTVVFNQPIGNYQLASMSTDYSQGVPFVITCRDSTGVGCGGNWLDNNMVIRYTAYVAAPRNCTTGPGIGLECRWEIARQVLHCTAFSVLLSVLVDTRKLLICCIYVGMEYGKMLLINVERFALERLLPMVLLRSSLLIIIPPLQHSPVTQAMS